MSTNKYMSRLPKGFALPSSLSGLDDNAPILVAFSGGADSSALLHILSEYAKQSGAIIYAAHVNHGIRGDESTTAEALAGLFLTLDPTHRDFSFLIR